MAGDQILKDLLILSIQIKSGKLLNSYDIALSTEQLLKNLISNGIWKNARDLMEIIKIQIRHLRNEIPEEITATNIMRHVLKVIREEYENRQENKMEEQSLHQLVTANYDDSALDYSESQEGFKTRLLDHLSEYKVELESSTDNIASQALEHIDNDVHILTAGKSSIVEKFLKYAGKKRRFHVIVVDAAPSYSGHLMAASLSKSGIQTTLIPDSAVFAMMSRVNKVIIGTHSVMADGGLQSAAGVHTLALAAKHYSVPVIVLAHMYKITPCYAKDFLTNLRASPAGIVPYSLAAKKEMENVNFYNPIFDYVPPELVTLLISHQGGNAPSYVYRLLSELYHQDDSDF